MMLTLKTLLTFSPLEMSLVPGENSSNTINLYCFPAGMFRKRKICMQNNPDPMLLEIRWKLPHDFTAVDNTALQKQSQICSRVGASWGAEWKFQRCSMLGSLPSHNPAFHRNTTGASKGKTGLQEGRLFHLPHVASTAVSGIFQVKTNYQLWGLQD